MYKVKEYWDKTWGDRITDSGHARLNGKKLEYICNQLWKRPQYAKLKKLEVGCGLGFHAMRMGKLYSDWRENWTGIDLSDVAIDWAYKNGLNALRQDFLKIDEEANNGSYLSFNKIQMFMFLDGLEHFEDLDGVAAKVKELADREFWIFGNVPLYRSEHTEEFERDMNIKVLHKFLMDCGCKKYNQHIYGIDGYPYMMFDATNGKGDV